MLLVHRKRTESSLPEIPLPTGIQDQDGCYY
jgi:hypothetical protein